MKPRFLPILLVVLGLLPAANASADILISENFSSGYTDGDITTQTATGTGLTGLRQDTGIPSPALPRNFYTLEVTAP